MSSSSAEQMTLSFMDSFKTHNSKAWEVAEYDFDHPHFDTDWRKENAIFGSTDLYGNKGLLLKIAPNLNPSASHNRFIGGSVKRKLPTRYGRYESLIKPAKGVGFVTGFFTYTGPYYGTQHDEIDIEFLGKNTKQIHIAWFQDGILTNKLIDLPFDAADKPRRYAFEWLPDQINWYVEDDVIFSVDKHTTNVPQTPSMLFANVWAADPTIEKWSGLTKPQQSGQAWFGDVKFTPYPTSLNSETLASLRTTETTVLVHPVSHE